MPDITSTFNALASSTNALLGDLLAPYALFLFQGRVIGTIAVDVPLREVHDHSYVITQNPTQAGYAAADGYFASPCRVEMTCGFSDSTAQYVGYAQQVFAAFLALAETSQPFSVSTGKKIYNNMMIENISVRTDPTTEYALDITVRLQEFIITDTDGASLCHQRHDTGQPSQSGRNRRRPSMAARSALQPNPTPGLTPSGFVAGPN